MSSLKFLSAYQLQVRKIDFDSQNPFPSSDRLASILRLSTVAAPICERLAFGNELRCEHQRADCEIPAVPRYHCLREFGNPRKERIFRSVLFAQFRCLR